MMVWGNTYGMGMGDGEFSGMITSGTGVEGRSEALAKPFGKSELEVKYQH